MKDVTNSVKIDGSSVTWPTEALAIGRYQLVFTVDGHTLAAPRVTIADKLTISKVAYTVSPKASFPAGYFDNQLTYP